MSFAVASFMFGFAFVSGGMLAYAICQFINEVVGLGLEKLFDKCIRR